MFDAHSISIIIGIMPKDVLIYLEFDAMNFIFDMLICNMCV